MTIQEFKAWLIQQVEGLGDSVDTSFVGQVEKNLEEAVTDYNSGLIENKNTILSEKKTLQAKLEELETKYAAFEDRGISVEEYEAMKTRIAEIESGKAPDNAEELAAAYEKGKRAMQEQLAPKIKEAEKKVTELDKEKKTLLDKHINALKDIELKKALSDLHVEADAYWFKGFSSSAEIQYNDVEDKLTVQLPSPSNPLERIPIEDWKKQFPDSKEGKRMIKVPDNYGGGANGSNGKGAGRALGLEDQLRLMFKN